MTFEIACSKCGRVLYAGFDLKPPTEIIRQYGNRCKECGVTLLTDTFRVEVEKFAGSFVPSRFGESTSGIPLRVRPPPGLLHRK